MSRSPSRVVAIGGTVCLIALCGSASAQWSAAGANCYCRQPVIRSCYQTVPTTEYRPVRQKVRRPVVETDYVEKEVTEYRPVTETRTANVPTVQYHNVTECRTVTRDCGRWVTRYRCNPRMSPCEYDNRPGLIGWLNRTSFSVRQAFTPPYVATRQYVPRKVTQTVPVTRRVAVRGTRKVTYNVTRMVPHRTTRKVPVRRVRYEEREVVTMKPVTVMRTVPTGTSLAYTYTPYTGGTTQTALAPTPDPVGSRSAERKSSRKRTAEAPKKSENNRDHQKDSSEQNLRESSNFDNGKANSNGTRRSSLRAPSRNSGSTVRQTRRTSRRPAPSIVRVNRWQSRTAPASRPRTAASALSIADANQ